jgi:hypothetical protein
LEPTKQKKEVAQNNLAKVVLDKLKRVANAVAHVDRIKQKKKVALGMLDRVVLGKLKK